MRIGPRTRVERINEDRVAIMDAFTGDSITITREVALALMPAMQYFFPASFVDITPLVLEVPT